MTREDIVEYYESTWSGRPADFDMLEDFCKRQEQITINECTDRAVEIIDYVFKDLISSESHLRLKLSLIEYMKNNHLTLH